MSDTQVQNIKKEVAAQTADTAQQGSRTLGANGGRNTRFAKKRNDRPREDKNKDYDFKIINVRRVTKMHKGGRRMKISVFVVVGDKKGKIGLGIGKGEDVRSAQEKAIAKAKKSLKLVTLKGNTIPHEVEFKYRSSKIILKPASPGTGVIAGSSLRSVIEVAGISDILTKILGTNNKITNAYAAVHALTSLRATRL